MGLYFGQSCGCWEENIDCAILTLVADGRRIPECHLIVRLKCFSVSSGTHERELSGGCRGWVVGKERREREEEMNSLLK